MALHRVLDDRESEAGSAGSPRSRLVGTVEALEDPLLIALGDADAMVAHGDLDDTVDELDPDSDAGPLRRIGDRVREKIPHGFAQHLSITAHVEGARAASNDLHAGGARLDRVGVDG